MSWHNAVREILATPLFTAALKVVSQNSLGRRALNFARPRNGVYRSFTEASKAMASWNQGGHESEAAIRRHAETIGMLRPSDYAALHWISRLGGESLHIFDYGGNIGNLYYNYRRFLPQSIGQMTWTVLDLPSVLKAGETLANEKQASELRFRNDVQSVTRDHVMLVSGALHYWESDLTEFANQFPEKPAAFVINRSPVHPTASYVTVQMRPRYAVPCIVRTIDEVRAAFLSAGYELADSWQVLELSLRTTFFPHLWVPWYSGFCFIRADQRGSFLTRRHQ